MRKHVFPPCVLQFTVRSFQRSSSQTEPDDMPVSPPASDKPQLRLLTALPLQTRPAPRRSRLTDVGFIADCDVLPAGSVPKSTDVWVRAVAALRLASTYSSSRAESATGTAPEWMVHTAREGGRLPGASYQPGFARPNCWVVGWLDRVFMHAMHVAIS